LKNALLAAAAALLFLSSCASNNKPNTDGGTPDAGGTSDGGSGVTAEQAAAAYASFECSVISCLFGVSSGYCSSGGDFGPFSGGNFDVALSVSDGRTRYDANVGAACLAALETLEGLSCAGETSSLFAAAQSLSASDGSSPCDGMFTGAVLNGGECYATQECSAGFCDFSGSACPGVCAPRRGTGVPCTDDEQCQEGSACVSEAGASTCQPKVLLQQGALCNASSECADGLYCDDTGTCTNAKVADGAECTADAQCAEGSGCLKPNMFAPTGTCTAKVAAGGACTVGGAFIFPYSNACKGLQVCAGLVMNGENVVESGKCQAPGAVGATCFPQAAGTLGGNGCFTDLVCDPATRKCAPAPAAGSACIEGRCGPGAYCNSASQCAAKKADGAVCESSDECVNQCDTSAGTPGVCAPQQSETCAP
jgi:hypothetical protein